MKRYKSSIPVRMDQYNIMMRMAHNPNSHLYKRNGQPNRAASHLAHFWNGYSYGTKYPHLIPGTSSIAYPIWRAGIDFKGETE